MPENELTADRFVDALRALERTGDADSLVELFADGAICGNLAAGEAPQSGPEGARVFWTQDHEMFGDASSEFRNAIDADDRIVLEWTRHVHDGEEQLEFSGVSVIEHSNGRIDRFFGYFDPAVAGS